jgi:hypothetical protein
MSAYFEGDRSLVEISAYKENGDTKVEFLPCERDYQVKPFIKKIH